MNQDIKIYNQKEEKIKDENLETNQNQNNKKRKSQKPWKKRKDNNTKKLNKKQSNLTKSPFYNVNPSVDNFNSNDILDEKSCNFLNDISSETSINNNNNNNFNIRIITIILKFL